jgi:hypothetical protein
VGKESNMHAEQFVITTTDKKFMGRLVDFLNIAEVEKGSTTIRVGVDIAPEGLHLPNQKEDATCF